MLKNLIDPFPGMGLHDMVKNIDHKKMKPALKKPDTKLHKVYFNTPGISGKPGTQGDFS